MMTGLLGAAYEWVKAAHIIFVIFWMAGLFMMPRYLVYHQEALVAGDATDAARWVERESKLRSIILTPAMIAVWVLGLLLAASLGLFSDVPGLGWLHAKLFFVLLLSGYH
ncbi:CopD family protein, partial [Bifidobacterium bifidum]|uniref:CopD family protein n=1 Tax=Bifidobacterium bifidum TaxID=1681 RepID=UPI001E2F842D